MRLSETAADMNKNREKAKNVKEMVKRNLQNMHIRNELPFPLSFLALRLHV